MRLLESEWKKKLRRGDNRDGVENKVKCLSLISTSEMKSMIHPEVESIIHNMCIWKLKANQAVFI
jgi:hypothetical protein